MKIRLNMKPVSINSAYPTGRNGRRFLTEEGKIYKEALGWEAKREVSAPSKSLMKVKYTFGFKDKRRRDIDDYLKLSQDALTGIWFDDDSQVVYIEATKIHSEDYFVEIEAWEIYQEFTSLKK